MRARAAVLLAVLAASFGGGCRGNPCKDLEARICATGAPELCERLRQALSDSRSPADARDDACRRLDRDEEVLREILRSGVGTAL